MTGLGKKCKHGTKQCRICAANIVRHVGFEFRLLIFLFLNAFLNISVIIVINYFNNLKSLIFDKNWFVI